MRLAPVAPTCQEKEQLPVLPAWVQARLTLLPEGSARAGGPSAPAAARPSGWGRLVCVSPRPCVPGRQTAPRGARRRGAGGPFQGPLSRHALGGRTGGCTAERGPVTLCEEHRTGGEKGSGRGSQGREWLRRSGPSSEGGIVAALQAKAGPAAGPACCAVPGEAWAVPGVPCCTADLTALGAQPVPWGQAGCLASVQPEARGCL